MQICIWAASLYLSSWHRLIEAALSTSTALLLERHTHTHAPRKHTHTCHVHTHKHTQQNDARRLTGFIGFKVKHYCIVWEDTRTRAYWAGTLSCSSFKCRVLRRKIWSKSVRTNEGDTVLGICQHALDILMWFISADVLFLFPLCTISVVQEVATQQTTTLSFFLKFSFRTSSGQFTAADVQRVALLTSSIFIPPPH